VKVVERDSNQTIPIKGKKEMKAIIVLTKELSKEEEEFIRKIPNGTTSALFYTYVEELEKDGISRSGAQILVETDGSIFDIREINGNVLDELKVLL